MLRKSAFMSSKESSTSIMCCFEVLVQSVPGQPSCHMSVIVKALVSKVCSPKSSAPRTWSSWFSCSTYMCTADGDHINFFAQFWLQGYSAADRSIRGLPLLQEVVFVALVVLKFGVECLLLSSAPNTLSISIQVHTDDTCDGYKIVSWFFRTNCWLHLLAHWPRWVCGPVNSVRCASLYTFTWLPYCSSCILNVSSQWLLIGSSPPHEFLQPANQNICNSDFLWNGASCTSFHSWAGFYVSISLQLTAI